MSYQVLARKWRPKSFEQLVGQKQTARALINALESQRLHHAYLFTGTRGVGKTTIARILSKSLNCEKGITSKPCGECSSCVEIDQGNFIDLMEIDAASNTGVEYTRELLNNVQYRPTRGRYKVYLIDEVHMLSTSSFNALLKTLEEPPPQVIFLLATTDPQKLPATVLSRCLQFHLKRMEESDIIDHLSMILCKEGISFEANALNPIAKGADGSMRDGLSLLDQAIAFSGDKLTLKAVQNMLGSIDSSYCFDLLQSIIDDDATQLMSIIQDMSQYSPDYLEIMSDWLSLLHSIAVVQATGCSADEKTTAFAEQVSPPDLQLFYQLSLQAKKDLPYAPHLRQGLEMALLRVLAFRPQPLVSGPASPAKKKHSNSLEEPTKAQNSNQSVEPTQVVPQQALVSEYFATNKVVQLNIQESVQSTELQNSASSINYAQQQNSVELKIDIEQETVDQQNLTSNIQQSQIGAQQTNSSHALKLVSNSNNKENNSSVEDFSEQQENKKCLYPDAPQVNLQDINPSNWHFCIDQMGIEGNGQQILLNSFAAFNNNQLTVTLLEEVEHFLTDNLRLSLTSAIKDHFNTAGTAVMQFSIKFTVKSNLTDTPKTKQVELHQQLLEGYYQQLIDNPCISLLRSKIGLMVDKNNIHPK